MALRTLIIAAAGAVARATQTLASASASDVKLTYTGLASDDNFLTSAPYTSTYTIDLNQGQIKTVYDPTRSDTYTEYDGPIQTTFSTGSLYYVIDTDSGFVFDDRFYNRRGQNDIVDAVVASADTSVQLYDNIEFTPSMVFTGSINGMFRTFDQNGNLTQDYALDALTISAAPEPSTWLLLLMGVGLVGTMLRWLRRPSPVAV